MAPAFAGCRAEFYEFRLAAPCIAQGARRGARGRVNVLPAILLARRARALAARELCAVRARCFALINARCDWIFCRPAFRDDDDFRLVARQNVFRHPLRRYRGWLGSWLRHLLRLHGRGIRVACDDHVLGSFVFLLDNNASCRRLVAGSENQKQGNARQNLSEGILQRHLLSPTAKKSC